MTIESDIEDLISGRRPELAYLLNEIELDSLLRGYRHIVDCLRRPSIFRDYGAASDNSLSSGIVGLEIIQDCPKLGGLARCLKGETRSVDHKSCVCAGIPMRRAKK
jgi:hypothetical protein